jgi:hypothetical protein
MMAVFDQPTWFLDQRPEATYGMACGLVEWRRVMRAERAVPAEQTVAAELAS